MTRDSTSTQYALMTPMWQRIAAGEVDLTVYTDDEILTGQLRMADGRLLPLPAGPLPEVFLREQTRRGLRKAEIEIRKSAMKALEVFAEILEDEEAKDKDRMQAGEFFLNRFLGKMDQHVHHHTPDMGQAREALVERLLAARRGLPAAVTQQLANGETPDPEVVDGEIVDDAVLGLEDLL